MGDNIKLKCYNCGNYINGVYNRSIANKALRTGGGLLGTYFGIPGSSFISNFTGDVIEEIAERGYDFKCPKCGSTYHYTEEEAKKITRYLEWEEERNEEIKARFPYYLIALALFLTGVYFLAFATISSTALTWITWIGTIIAGIVTGFIITVNNDDYEIPCLILFGISTFVCWLLAKGINLFVFAEITNAAGDLTSSGWMAWIFTIIGGLLIIPALLFFICASLGHMYEFFDLFDF